MLTLAVRGMRARPVRSALSFLSVVLGVAMIAGTLIFIDTIHRAYGQIFHHAARGADVIVSGRGSDSASSTQPPSIPAAVAARISSLASVARAEGQISDRAALVGRDGHALRTQGAPTIALSFLHPPFQALTVASGRAPSAPGEVAVDEQTAHEQGIGIGGQVRIGTLGPVELFTVTGLVRFGDAAVGGATFLVFDLATAQRLFAKPGLVDTLFAQAAPGHSAASVAAEIARILPADLQVRTAAAQAHRNTDRVVGQVGFITDALLAFSLLAVLVGALVIFNTFSITVTQRAREFALLRTLGATRGQVRSAVAIEALILGIGGSLAGIAAGLLGDQAIRVLFSALGTKLPATAGVMAPRTILVGLGVGTLVALGACLVPALRATRVSPVTALGAGAPPHTLRPRLRRVIPLVATAMLIAGLTLALASSSVGLSIAGAATFILAVAALSPRMVGPGARVAGWPAERMTAVVGRLARENVSRNPGRTAITAGALVIGLGVALLLAILANGTRISIRDVIARSVTGDLAIVHRDGSSPIPTAAAVTAASVPGVQAASVFKQADSTVVGTGDAHAHAIDPLTILSVYRFDWTQGSDDLLGFLGPSGVLVERRLADRAHLIVGSPLRVRTRTGQRVKLVVRGIYNDRALLDGYVLGLPAFDALFHVRRSRLVLVELLGGVDRAVTQRRLAVALNAFPEVTVRSQRQLADAESSRLNTVLYLFYALLAVSLLVSMLGIINALTLSTYERTRELALLRVLGMSRRQVRRTVRYESVITAALGAVLGLGLGIFCAEVLTAAFADRSFRLVIPWDELLVLVALALALGVIAAIPPARTAAKLDVLRAIAHE